MCSINQNRQVICRQKGFTLIELLVVIAIIALLMAIIMPALQKVRKQGRFIVCRSNLKQYGIAGRMYLNDYDEKFPSASTWLFSEGASGGNIYNPCDWHDGSKVADGVLWFYLKDMDVHMCPTFYTLSKTLGAEHPNHDPRIPIDPQYSYSMNAFLGPTIIGGFGGGAENVRKSTEVKNPSKVIFFSEENCWVIEGLSTLSLNNNILYTREGDPWNCIGTYHQTRGGDLNSGVANIVFVDGSVGTGMAKDSFKLANPRGHN